MTVEPSRALRQQVVLNGMAPAGRERAAAMLDRASSDWFLRELEEQARDKTSAGTVADTKPGIVPRGAVLAARRAARRASPAPGGEPCPCGCGITYRGLTSRRRAAILAHPHHERGIRTTSVTTPAPVR
jgi:hypothetical protein